MVKTEIVGIHNATPDSFSDGGLYNSPEQSVSRIADLFNAGASIVDVGAESTRPGAQPLSDNEEWQRLEPFLQSVVTGYIDCISIDTYHPETIRRAAEIGSVIINDVTSFADPKMREVAAELGFRCIVSHIPNSAGTDVQAAHNGKLINSVEQIVDEQLNRVDEMIYSGIHKECITLDPGFGFAKTFKTNYALLEYAKYVPDYDVMLGISRKKSIMLDPISGKMLAEFDSMTPKAVNEWLDNRSAELGIIASKAGTRLLRVHNVEKHVRELRYAMASSDK